MLEASCNRALTRTHDAASLPVIIAIVDRGAKLDETFVQCVRHRVNALRHDHDGLPVGSLQVHDVALATQIRPNVTTTCSRWLARSGWVNNDQDKVAPLVTGRWRPGRYHEPDHVFVSHLDGEHGDALWAVDAVPDAEVASVLSHHHIAAGHPLDIRAEAQQRGLHAAPYVVQLELRRRTETSGRFSRLNASTHRFGLCTFCWAAVAPWRPPAVAIKCVNPPTTSIFNKAPPSIVLPWSSAGKDFNKDRPVDEANFNLRDIYDTTWLFMNFNCWDLLWMCVTSINTPKFKSARMMMDKQLQSSI